MSNVQEESQQTITQAARSAARRPSSKQGANPSAVEERRARRRGLRPLQGPRRPPPRSTRPRRRLHDVLLRAAPRRALVRPRGDGAAAAYSERAGAPRVGRGGGRR